MIGMCGWCEMSIEDGEPWVQVEESAQGMTLKTKLHVPQCFEGWRERTPTVVTPTKVSVNVIVDVKSEDKP